MKIALISASANPAGSGFMEKRVSEIASTLSKKNEVHIYCNKFWNGKSELKKNNIFFHGITDIESIEKGKKSFSGKLSFSVKLLRELKKEEFDLIDCQNFSFLSCLASKLSSKKSKLVFSWYDFLGAYWLVKYPFIGMLPMVLEDYLKNSADKNIALSSTLKEKINKSELIPFGLNLKELSKVKKSKKKFQVIYAGPLIKEKNLSFLIKSLDENVKALFIGEGPERDFLEKLSLDENKDVSFMNPLNEKETLSLIKASKLFVLTSKRENLNFYAFQAMALGTPVVSLDYSMNDVSNYIRKTGLVVPAIKTTLKANINRLLQNPFARAKIAREQKQLMKQHEIGKSIEELETLYKKLTKI